MGDVVKYTLLVNCTVNDPSSDAITNAQQTLLQLICEPVALLVDTLLDDIPDLVKSTGLRSCLFGGHGSG